MLDRLYAIVPRDKLLHFGLMALIALSNAAAWLLAVNLSSFAQEHPLFVFLLLLGATVGAVKEACDKMDNDLCAAEGRPPMHGVELLDWVATVFGAVAVALGLVLLGVA